MCLRRVMRRVELRPDTDHTVRLRVYIVASDRACDRVVCRMSKVGLALWERNRTVSYTIVVVSQYYGNAPLHAVRIVYHPVFRARELD